MIRAAIFDLDGTLVQTEVLKARAYAEVVRQLRKDETTDAEVLDLYKRKIGETRDGVSRFLMEELDLEAACHTLMPRYDVQEPWQVLTAMRVAAYEDIIADPQVLKDHQWPHNIGLLRITRAEYCRTALATSSQTNEALHVLRALDLEDQFDVVIGVDQVKNAKPDPEIYLLAASKLDVPPEECLVIEDSPPGVRAGLAAGMNVVAVAHDLTELGLHTDSGLEHRWVVHDPPALLEVVQRRIAEHNRAVHDRPVDDEKGD